LTTVCRQTFAITAVMFRNALLEVAVYRRCMSVALSAGNVGGLRTSNLLFW